MMLRRLFLLALTFGADVESGVGAGRGLVGRAARRLQRYASFSAWADGDRTVLLGAAPLTCTATYVDKPPVARAAATPASGQAPLTVAFSGAQSSDPEGDNLIYHWDFGDGATSSAPNPTHAYSAPTTYHATLTVTDALGASRSASITVKVKGNALPRKLWLPLVIR